MDSRIWLQKYTRSRKNTLGPAFFASHPLKLPPAPISSKNTHVTSQTTLTKAPQLLPPNIKCIHGKPKPRESGQILLLGFIHCLPSQFRELHCLAFKWGPLWLFLGIWGQGWFSEVVFSTIGHSHFKQTNKKKTHHASSPAQRCSPTIRISLKAFCSPLKISSVDRCKLSIQRLKIPGWEGARGEVLINSSNWLLLHRWCLVYLGNCKGHFTANQLNENLLNPF